ncbi:hypothetical protein DERP_008896 [Dermatophagoides pteronyssinus]|uniref:Uncharacterized protein n=1 Tax=Dermatophagoides pteronyssinus TaxID=6956 RepID=A0ABQ8JN60_DERPT|nr:hypothetical protein DERP_008896 [Dermatophagoides pteronyssinus]
MLNNKLIFKFKSKQQQQQQKCTKSDICFIIIILEKMLFMENLSILIYDGNHFSGFNHQYQNMKILHYPNWIH